MKTLILSLLLSACALGQPVQGSRVIGPVPNARRLAGKPLCSATVTTDCIKPLGADGSFSIGDTLPNGGINISPTDGITSGSTTISPVYGLANTNITPYTQGLPVGLLDARWNLTGLADGTTSVANGVTGKAALDLNAGPTLSTAGITISNAAYTDTQYALSSTTTLDLAGNWSLLLVGRFNAAGGRAVNLDGGYNPVVTLASTADDVHYQALQYVGTSGGGVVKLYSRQGVGGTLVEHYSSTLALPVGTDVAIQITAAYGTITLTRLDTGASVSCVNSISDEITTVKIGLGVDYRSGFNASASYLFLSYAALYHDRQAMTRNELSQAIGWLKGYLGTRGVYVPDLYVPQPDPPTLPDNGLARTPPMGWSSWNSYRTSLTDSLIRASADALVASGMKSAGYEYVIIDEPGFLGRDADGSLILDTAKFPNGIKPVCDYIHSLGLKCGFYAVPGPQTCAGYTGMLGYEAQDIATFAAWGVDYLKADFCTISEAAAPYITAYGNLAYQGIYSRIGKAIQSTGRPMVYSILLIGRYGVEGWAKSAGANVSRTGYDLQACWECVVGGLDNDVTGVLDIQVGKEGQTEPGAWFADPDMLQVGNGTLTEEENKSHFAMWAMMAAPLLAGNDLTTMSAATKAILTNADIIAVDQDPLGKQAFRVSQTACGGANCEVWAKELTGTTTCAIALLNRDSAPHDITATFATIAGTVSACGTGPYATTKDLWTGASLGTLTTSYTATAVPAHGTAIIRVAL